ncbi:MAG: type II toxin-antitoxin system mRNA interferase toxin, RelE/StbE family [Candidatus Daviesbacteria bacterium]|nr:type II toxin-antitoxin system mRNA interferase toxin, RelE/StbE family [Candidatus Daviesbacteria bacterium]
MQTKFAKKFKKQYEKADAKIKSAFDKKLELFLQDPFHPLLNNHSLTGKYLEKRSINITGDWRAIFSEAETEEEKVINFELLDIHSNLYK